GADGNPKIRFGPVIENVVGEGDEKFISKSALETILSTPGEHLVPWMAGFTSGDGAILVASMLRTEGCLLCAILTYGFFILLNQMYTDLYFSIDTDSGVKLHSKAGATVYYYYFDYRGENSFSSIFGGTNEDYGVCHMDELMYLFPQDHMFSNSTKTAEDDEMVDIMTTIWTNFARTGPRSVRSSHRTTRPDSWAESVPNGKQFLSVAMLTLQLICFCLLAAVWADYVDLPHGRLQGHRLLSRKGREIFSFQGIPYAKPPVGELRFQPPQPPEPWTGVLKATKEGPDCIQRPFPARPNSPEIVGDEDCLYLNVYTPQLPADGEATELLPVMVWIHGGGLLGGSGSTDLYGPQYLLDKEIVLVTINYRLGPLGFLSTGDEVCPGNNGFKDQVAALRWVRDNIAAFGGNPDSVTIFGESAGGVSVHYLVLSEASRGLFHRGISQSGTATCTWSLASQSIHKESRQTLADKLDCPTEPSSELISCLRKVDADKIVRNTPGPIVSIMS
ncbi:hypothetical protein ANN_13646, partial [Periplaneta americana]